MAAATRRPGLARASSIRPAIEWQDREQVDER